MGIEHEIYENYLCFGGYVYMYFEEISRKVIAATFPKKMFPLNGGRGDGHVQWNGQGDILQYSMSYILGEIYIYTYYSAVVIYIHIILYYCFLQYSMY